VAYQLGDRAAWKMSYVGGHYYFIAGWRTEAMHENEMCNNVLSHEGFLAIQTRQSEMTGCDDFT
jgi:YHS domain-containing protein